MSTPATKKRSNNANTRPGLLDPAFLLDDLEVGISSDSMCSTIDMRLSHGDFSRTVVDVLGHGGYTVNRANHAVLSDGNTYIGVLQLDGGDAHAIPVAVTRQSHGGRYASYMYVGIGLPKVHSFVLSHQIALGRAAVDYKAMLTKAIEDDYKGIGLAFRNHVALVKALMEMELTDHDAMYLLCEQLRRGCFKQGVLPHLIESWHSPDTDELLAMGNTAYRLMCSVAYYYHAFGSYSANANVKNTLACGPELYHFWLEQVSEGFDL